MTWEEVLIFAFLFGGTGFLFGKTFKTERPKNKKAEEEAPSAFFDEEKFSERMALRNGFKVTADKNPTIAEQWVNIMNYSGENQKEENYEETKENHTEDNLE